MTDRIIHHMCRADEWDAARPAGRYPGSSQDVQDGFIHFSTAAQVVESAAKHRAGQDGLLLLTVDAQLNITAATSETLWMPYPGACNQHGDAYACLVGLNLMQGFRQAVQERLAGTRGCTHLTELCLVLPTAVIQAFAGSVIDTREGDAGEQPPFQLDRCHALRRDGDTVATFYPRWHLPAEPATTAS